jgi:NAD(P)-dependent dehydrogenase (short-subunit alcohol dehydrogenase family)
MTKIALITGGSRGLGKSMALHLAECGRDTIITYHSQKEQAQAVVKSIKEMGQKAVALQLDIRDVMSFSGFAHAVRDGLKENWGCDHFDYLINNAGSGIWAEYEKTSEEQFDNMMKEHVKAPFFLTQALLPMIKQGGRILNVSSGLTRMIMPGYAAYAVMKTAVEGLSLYMAKELGARGIAVNTLAPGAIETDFGGGMVRDNADINLEIANSTSLGRVGLPDDIGGAVASILSDDAGWINAQRIEVSGGQRL